MTSTNPLPGIRSALFIGLSLLLSGVAIAQNVPAWFLSLPDDPALLAGRGAVALGGGSKADGLVQAKREAMRDLSESLLCNLTT